MKHQEQFNSEELTIGNLNQVLSVRGLLGDGVRDHLSKTWPKYVGGGLGVVMGGLMGHSAVEASSVAGSAVDTQDDINAVVSLIGIAASSLVGGAVWGNINAKRMKVEVVGLKKELGKLNEAKAKYPDTLWTARQQLKEANKRLKDKENLISESDYREIQGYYQGQLKEATKLLAGELSPQTLERTGADFDKLANVVESNEPTLQKLISERTGLGWAWNTTSEAGQMSGFLFGLASAGSIGLDTLKIIWSDVPVTVYYSDTMANVEIVRWTGVGILALLALKEVRDRPGGLIQQVEG